MSSLSVGVGKRESKPEELQKTGDEPNFADLPRTYLDTDKTQVNFSLVVAKELGAMFRFTKPF